jgi:hypothetical protein
LEEDSVMLLNAMMKGPIERKIQSMSSLLYTLDKERFGVVETKEKLRQPHRPNKRQ